jgi:3-oxoacyl-[acyl-carrier protein] reductase
MELKGCAAIVTGGSGGLGQRIMEGTRMSANRPAEYAATVPDITLLRHAVSKDDVAEQLVTFCRSDSVTGQTVVMDCGRF